MKNYFNIKALSVTLLMILLFIIKLPVCAASDSGITESYNLGRIIKPNSFPVYTLEEMLNWYNMSSTFNDFPFLGQDLLISSSISFEETEEQKELGTQGYTIRVTAGSCLTINNSKFSLQGLENLIIVETGGQLILQNGTICSSPDYNAIVVENGGRITKADSFLIQGGAILDKNSSEEMPPEEPVYPIQKTTIDDFYMFSVKGEQPELSAYPATVDVVCVTGEFLYQQKELPVQWQLDQVNFNKAGIYTVKGIFSEEVLAAQKVSNPDNVTAVLHLVIQEPGSIKNMSGNVLRVESSGICSIRLTLPALPADAAEIYVYRSADGVHWTKALAKDAQTEYENFQPFIQTVKNETYINYRYKTDYGPIWFRVEIVGSIYAGSSNIVRLDMPASAKPGESVIIGTPGDDGSSGGNRGGGGQSEAERELPDTPKQTENGSASSSYVDSGKKASDSETNQSGSEESQIKQIRSSVLAFPESESASDTNEEGSASTSAASVQKLVKNGGIHKSRGVFLTAGITILVAALLLIIRKLYKSKKKKS